MPTDFYMKVRKDATDVVKNMYECEECLQNGLLDVSSRHYGRAVKKSIALAQDIIKHGYLVGIPQAGLDDVAKREYETRLSVRDGIVRLRVEGVLPYKSNGSFASSGKELIHEVWLRHLPEQYEALPRDCKITYTEKVVMCIVQHYAKGRQARDCDNLEIKPFIDTLRNYFLIDDSPKYMSMFVDYVPEDEDYAEFIIVPQRRFFESGGIEQYK